MTNAPTMTGSSVARLLTVVYRPISFLIPDPRNARTHPKRQIEQIIASIAAFGFTNPVLADPEGRLIAGHGRLLAAKQMGLAEVPVIELAGLSEAQKKALRLADNKIALGAGWDMEILKLELADLSLPEFEMDLALTGFSSGEIDVVLGEGIDPDDDVIPDVPTEPKSRLGDIWQLGEHRIGCGDGRDLEFLRAVVGGGEAIDAAFLDSAAARASLAAIETARESRHPPEANQVLRIVVITYGIGTVLRTLGLGIKRNPLNKQRVRWELNPWMVEAALDRFGDRILSHQEQRDVWHATHKPESVKWPEWWVYCG